MLGVYKLELQGGNEPALEGTRASTPVTTQLRHERERISPGEADGEVLSAEGSVRARPRGAAEDRLLEEPRGEAEWQKARVEGASESRAGLAAPVSLLSHDGSRMPLVCLPPMYLAPSDHTGPPRFPGRLVMPCFLPECKLWSCHMGDSTGDSKGL